MGFNKKSIWRDRGKSGNLKPLKLSNFFNSHKVSGISRLILALAAEIASAAKLMIELSLCTPSITSQVPSLFVAINNEGTGIPKKIDSISADCLESSHLNCLWYSGAISIILSLTIDINSFTLIS